MSTELTVRESAMPLPNSLSEIEKYAAIFVKSGLFGEAGSLERAAVKILAGREHNMAPFEAMSSFDIIKGKVAMSANCMARMIKASGKYTYRTLQHTSEICELEFFERDGDKWSSIGVSSFTLADARKAQTQNIDKFPRNMLFARALSNGAKWYTPDVFNTTPYVPEDFDALPEPANTAKPPEDTGTTIDVASEPVPPEDDEISAAKPRPPDAKGWALFEPLARLFGVEVCPTAQGFIGRAELHKWVETLTGEPYPASKGLKTIGWWETVAEPLALVGHAFEWDADRLGNEQMHLDAIATMGEGVYRCLCLVPGAVLVRYANSLMSKED